MPKKLERLTGPADDNRGPAQGHGTEHGDTWRMAVAKMNAVIDAINESNGFGGDADGIAGGTATGNAHGTDPNVVSRLAAVEDDIATMKPIVEMARDFLNDEPDLTEDEVNSAFANQQQAPFKDPQAQATSFGTTADLPAGEAPAEGIFTEFSQHADEAAAETSATAAPPLQDHTDGAFDPTGATFRIGDGGGTADGEPDPRTLRDNPEVLGTLGGAASGEGQIIGASEMPGAVITTGEPENRDELIQLPDGTYHPITPTDDESGVVMTGAEGQSNPQPNPQGQAVEPEAPEPIATFDGEPGIPSGGTRDEESANNRFVASGASGQVVAEQYADNLAQKPGQAGDPRPDGEPLPASAVIADREQERQAAEEVTAANTLKPDVDPEQAVDNPATPPSGETLERADRTALNNVRTGPK